MFDNLDDIEEGTDEEVEQELKDMGIELTAVTIVEFKTKLCHLNKK